LDLNFYSNSDKWTPTAVKVNCFWLVLNMESLGQYEKSNNDVCPFAAIDLVDRNPSF
jgi:hypothetical protein